MCVPTSNFQQTRKIYRNYLSTLHVGGGPLSQGNKQHGQWSPWDRGIDLVTQDRNYKLQNS